MKTILYQPLFINPQAYFVFPQLYHIEKGDSYIEPANITGQLIINDLTKVLTSTPTLNVVQDTNQVDFGLFKGKHIRISQYTNIGAVVLGEWYIPGTPTPPEPEQPDLPEEDITDALLLVDKNPILLTNGNYIKLVNNPKIKKI